MIMFMQSFLALATVAWILCVLGYGFFLLFRRNGARLRDRLISFAALLGLGGAGVLVAFVAFSFLGEL